MTISFWFACSIQNKFFKVFITLLASSLYCQLICPHSLSDHSYVVCYGISVYKSITWHTASVLIKKH